jgi:hypothetical protein
MLPPRSFYSLTEAAARWSVTPFDVIGWATDGLLALSIALPPVKTGPSETLSGLVDIEAPHALPLFRRDGAPSPTVAIRRVKAGENDFRWIAEPAEGIVIVAADVLVRRVEVEKFEQRFGSFEGAYPSPRGAVPARGRRPGPGVPPRHDWDSFYAALARRIHEHGIPKTQAELVREMRDWFEQREDEHAPDESTIARKIRIVWQELCRA